MKIVIVGGGFGGVYTALRLRKLMSLKAAQILVIDRTNYFLFTPMLHEVATGGLAANSVAEPIRELFKGKNIDFYKGEVRKINKKNKQVYVDDQKIDYDYLVLATGATTNFYGVTHKNVFTLKNLHDAASIRSHLIDQLESADKEKDHSKKRDLLRFVVVGGGPTGVELVAEIAELIFGAIERKYNIDKSEIEIMLIHSRDKLINQFKPKNQKYAKRVLLGKGIKLKLKSRVSKVENNTIHLESGERIPTNTVIWTAGVMANILESEPELILNERKRILVNGFLQSKDYKEVFALGDAGTTKDPVPMLAQAAVSEAKYVAENIYNQINKKELKHFKFKSKGMLISLGQWQAAGEIGPITFRGPIAWWLWRTVYLFKFPTWRKKIKIAAEWTANLFQDRDLTRE